MQDKTINNALLALRKQAIRGDGEGLHHVEALLAARGVDMPRVLPAKRSDVARRIEMRRLILEALRDDPKTLPELAAYAASKRTNAAPDRAYSRVSQCLCKMKKAGLVKHEGRSWHV